ncbi:MarR family winged helix-turn-helix transcriptional regulator [Rhizorhabdus sp. FW153]|uniref:MarR family winged helix-turn-helix transcriptional regulator n=1 Tax=Rhizorhabdus sp. FW153 TaxID=3400216 RepID=UPI003CEAFCF5
MTSLENPVAQHLGYRMRRASIILMGRAAQAAERFGLSITQGTVLTLISANPGCRQRDLCEELGIKRANMTPIIAALEAQGLLDRAAIDGRSQAMRLTTKGRQLTNALLADLEATDARISEVLAAEELSELKHILARLERGLAP